MLPVPKLVIYDLCDFRSFICLGEGSQASMRQHYEEHVSRRNESLRMTLRSKTSVKYTDWFKCTITRHKSDASKRGKISIRHVQKSIYQLTLDFLGIEWGDMLYNTVRGEGQKSPEENAFKDNMKRVFFILGMPSPSFGATRPS